MATKASNMRCCSEGRGGARARAAARAAAPRASSALPSRGWWSEWIGFHVLLPGALSSPDNGMHSYALV